jgi:hypothetical protein
MAVCDQCGNDYDKSFVVTTADGTTRIVDSFECARFKTERLVSRSG